MFVCFSLDNGGRFSNSTSSATFGSDLLASQGHTRPIRLQPQHVEHKINRRHLEVEY